MFRPHEAHAPRLALARRVALEDRLLEAEAAPPVGAASAQARCCSSCFASAQR
jgi:hypothetical protein